MYNLLKMGNTCSNKQFKEDYMRRNRRVKENNNKDLMDKIILYSMIGVAVLAVIVGGILLYSKNSGDEEESKTISLEEMANMTSNNTENTESASSQIGKTVEESENETNNENTANTSNTSNTTNQNAIVNTNKTNTSSSTANTNTNTQTTNANTTQEVETKKELNFVMPVEGEISREYAKDNLIYSETLQEWVTHLGIDIKADKTTVVKASEAGTIKSIKNDPRYGLTIVIDHGDGYETVYSNLLTSEFVVEGEEVEQGQSIGTVGNTAVFEIADEPHLHFEILKDSVQIDPNSVLK